MKKSLLLLFILMSVMSSFAQTKDFSFKFYGRIRADLFYNSRANNELIDGMFYLYPKDQDYDANGEDLNATPQGSIYFLCSRLGVDVEGPKIGSARTSAKIEADFRGGGTTLNVLRVRHAYVNLDWGKSQLLIGQTWHPLFGEVFPNMINLCTGAPFEPFSRNPQLRYRYTSAAGVQFTGAAVWQNQYTSMGPDGKSNTYQKNGLIPELYAGINYRHGGFLGGVGVEMLTLKPRTKANIDGNIYKVNERVTSFSFEAHAKYNWEKLMISAKTTLANNLTHVTMLGGFGVVSEDERTGECKYTPFRNSSTWLNIIYGKKWQPGCFFGYMKNLGTGKAISGPVYGVGLDVDQLMGASAQLSYNLPHWKVGAEIGSTTAWYGDLDKKNGRVVDTHAVTNLRLVLQMMYIF